MLRTPSVPEGEVSVWAQYTVQAEDRAQRDRIMEGLKTQGIPTACYYPIPMHLSTAYASFGYQKGDLPVCESGRRARVQPADASLFVRGGNRRYLHQAQGGAIAGNAKASRCVRDAFLKGDSRDERKGCHGRETFARSVVGVGSMGRNHVRVCPLCPSSSW